MAISGIDVEEFATRFGRKPGDVYGDILGELDDAGLLTVSNGSVKLTDRGRLLGNEVFSRFFG